jgi:hypothetical protein
MWLNITSQRRIEMKETARNEIEVLLNLLKESIKNNGLSLATDKDGNIMFFDTATYLKSKKMDGFKVNIKDLVEG